MNCQAGYRCKGCSRYENMEYHDWQCPHCGHDNLKMKICINIELEAELSEDEVRVINKLSEKQYINSIKEIKEIIKNSLLEEFNEEDIKKLEVNYEDIL